MALPALKMGYSARELLCGKKSAFPIGNNVQQVAKVEWLKVAAGATSNTTIDRD